MGEGAGAVLLIDAHDALGQALGRALAAQGRAVIALVRPGRGAGLPDGVCAIEQADPVAWLRDPDNGALPLSAVLIGPPDGLADDTAWPDTAHDAILRFLDVLQAAGRRLARGDGGQLWVMTREDSLRDSLGLPLAAMESQARHAAVKSFAKEMLRFGVRVNCAQLQACQEDAGEDAWRAARDGLKAYAMKFRPIRATDAAQALCGFLAQPALPLAGMVVPLGIGFIENNL
ncbi:hypothetical protein ANDA3_2303 [plant metagenome]|uniref:SDR family oxidoreductase n=2 Tax=root TaxID=1 RepID=A0A1C3JX01_9BURK|nr:hypothetical protein [Orrella dioscoreae]SBT23799.1 hypothetical protein ODI_01181 [Orrella dioscoreae]SOE49711.1 hypothetical protein ODI_R2263 [Orrella dioscoreae]